jgi:hypothetical protein
MKKLLLLFLFTISANAQFQNAYPPINLCDDNNDQFAVFDLTQLTPTILAAVNSNDYTVIYFDSYGNAQNNTNPIVTPNSYVNLQPAIQTVGIRIVNNTTNVVSFSTVDIRVYPRPLANPATLSFCDPTELVLYDLNSAIPQITSDPAAVVTFYESLPAAQTQSNPINTFNPYIPTINPGVQTLYATVTNSVGCINITTVTLISQTCGSTCLAPNNLTASMITETTATIGWTDTSGNTQWEVLVLPVGVPDPLPSSSGILIPQNLYTITGLNAQTCYAVYVRTVCALPASSTSSWTGPLNFCTNDCTTTGTCTDNLTFVAFLDTNNNGVKDTGESDFNYGTFEYEVNNSGTTLHGYPNYGLFHIFDSNPINSYTVNFVVEPNYTAYFSSATNYTNITLPAGSGLNIYYFPITVVQTLNDLEIMLASGGNPRPGFTYYSTIIYRNKGSQTVSSGTVTFTKAPLVSIVSVTEIGTTPTANGFQYTFNNLAPNETRYISVGMQVPTIPTVNLGDFLTNSVTIEPLTGDVFPANNSAQLTQAVVGSYDPNDKAESHGGRIVHTDFTSNDYLYYTIRFENTGTANAEFIRLEDVLNADLDETTFEMLNASHPVNTRRENNQLTWHFYNIDLPPTVSHPNDSHGYVHFRIKPKAGYALGDVIPNTASIFFDYNPPIVTNTFNTEFVENLGTPSFSSKDILMYPNPANQSVTIDLSQSAENLSEIVFYDVVGKKVKVVNSLGEKQMTVNVSDLSKGIYLIEIQTENQLKTIKKLMIQ